MRRERPGAARHAGRDGDPARRDRARGRRVLPGLHALLASLAGDAAARAREDAHAGSPCRPRFRGAGCLRSAISLAAKPRPSCSPAARRRGPRGSRRFSRTASGTTTSCTTTCRPTEPRASAPTCTSAACHRSQSPSAHAAARARSRSSASSAGVTSLRNCSRPAPTCRRWTSARATIAGARTTPGSRPGSRAVPAFRSSMRECASSCARASCTTALVC